VTRVFFLGLFRWALLLPPLAVVLVVIAWAVAPSVFTSHNPDLAVIGQQLQPPSLRHPFGTDALGRDLFSRVVYGTRPSITGAAVAVGVATIAASVLGGAAGYLGGRVDTTLMRLVDIALSIPGTLLALIVIAVVGPGTLHVALAVGVASAAGLSRITRAEVRRVATSPFVEHARHLGAGRARVLATHALPNASGPLLSLLLPELAGAVLAVSTLSFLGFGAQPPAAEWGSLISDGVQDIFAAWWLTGMPSIVIVVFVLALFLTGRQVRVTYLHRAG
jgi:peptide/nickel transport system permease protein